MSELKLRPRKMRTDDTQDDRQHGVGGESGGKPPHSTLNVQFMTVMATKMPFIGRG